MINIFKKHDKNYISISKEEYRDLKEKAEQLEESHKTIDYLANKLTSMAAKQQKKINDLEYTIDNIQNSRPEIVGFYFVDKDEANKKNLEVQKLLVRIARLDTGEEYIHLDKPLYILGKKSEHNEL